MFADPYSGRYESRRRPSGEGTPPRHNPDPYRQDYPDVRGAGDEQYGYSDGYPDGGRRGTDDDATTVLNFGADAFDGPPPAPGPRYDDEYVGGYSYAARDHAGVDPDAYDPDAYDPDTYDTDTYDTDVHEYDRAEFDEPSEAPDDPDGDERAVPTAVGATGGKRRGRGAGRDRAVSGRKRRGRVVGALALAMLLLVAVGGGYLAYERFAGPGAAPDFTGPAGPEVVVQVHPGDTAQEIGNEFVDNGVVASSAAFYEAAVQNSGMNTLHPGFYRVPTNVPGIEAVAALVDPQNRVGSLVISEGRQLHDIRDVNTGAVRKGIYTLISEASCKGDADAQTCVTYEALDEAGATTDLAVLGVPTWAREAVADVPDRRRQLEGLIAAGSWDFDPTSEPVEILARLVSESAARYDATGITEAAPRVGLTPYELLISASLVEREAMPDDFTKVARVILNRLEINQMLQFDSTVNYELDETELATTDADRARVTPWNTYAMVGLPATPISSPSIGALQAMENPEPGEWTYFVTIDAQGTTLFADTYEEHLQNTTLALESGILNSGR